MTPRPSRRHPSAATAAPADTLQQLQQLQQLSSYSSYSSYSSSSSYSSYSLRQRLRRSLRRWRRRPLEGSSAAPHAGGTFALGLLVGKCQPPAGKWSPAGNRRSDGAALPRWLFQRGACARVLSVHGVRCGRVRAQWLCVQPAPGRQVVGHAPADAARRSCTACPARERRARREVAAAVTKLRDTLAVAAGHSCLGAQQDSMPQRAALNSQYTQPTKNTSLQHTLDDRDGGRVPCGVISSHPSPSRNSFGAAWSDFDGDGDLDRAGGELWPGQRTVRERRHGRADA